LIYRGEAPCHEGAHDGGDISPDRVQHVLRHTLHECVGHDAVYVGTRCTLSDAQLWAGETLTFFCLVSLPRGTQGRLSGAERPFIDASSPCMDVSIRREDGGDVSSHRVQHVFRHTLHTTPFIGTRRGTQRCLLGGDRSFMDADSPCTDV